MAEPGSAGADDAPHANCQRCTSMISAKGFETLCSSKGFRHYNKIQCLRSAADGCPLCSIIVKRSVAGTWDDTDELVFYTSAFDGEQEPAVLRTLEDLSGRRSSDGKSIAILRLHADEGQYLGCQ